VRWTMLALAHVQWLVRITGFVKVVMRAASSPFRSSCKLLEDGSRSYEHARGVVLLKRTTSMLGWNQSRLDSDLAWDKGSTGSEI
jgi:hypothetical protein